MSGNAVFVASCILVILCLLNAEPAPNDADGDPELVEGSQGYVVVSGGSSGDQSHFLASCNAYDIALDTWKPLPDLPIKIHGHGSVTYKENVYIADGYYTDQFAVLNSSGWIEGPPLTTMKFDKAIMVATNDSMYVIGCNSKHIEKFSCCDAVIAWQPSWQPMADSSVLHYYAAGAELNGYIYVCGAGSTASNFCERYNTQNNSWETIRPMNLARNYHQMVSLNGKLYVLGGAKGKNEMYDPANDTWTSFSYVANQTYFAAATTDGEKIYVIGGSSATDGNHATNMVNVVNVYYPNCDIWQPRKSYPIPLGYAAATFVKSLP